MKRKMNKNDLKDQQARSRAESSLEMIVRRQDAEFDAELNNLDQVIQIRLSLEKSNPYDLDQQVA